jgi:hypothetical protein
VEKYAKKTLGDKGARAISVKVKPSPGASGGKQDKKNAKRDGSARDGTGRGQLLDEGKHDS